MKVTVRKGRRKTVVIFQGDEGALALVNAALEAASARPDPAAEEMNRRLDDLQSAYDRLDLEGFKTALERVFPPKDAPEPDAPEPGEEGEDA